MPLDIVLSFIGFIALVLLVTGPGLWSENWGWKWLNKLDQPPAEKRAETPDAPESAKQKD